MGDESTKFFHKYANCRKHIKSVWKIEKEDGSWVNFFYDIAVEGVNSSNIYLRLRIHLQ